MVQGQVQVEEVVVLMTQIMMMMNLWKLLLWMMK
jgi:hypothetical protein